MAIIQSITINNSTSAVIQSVEVVLQDLDLGTQRTLNLLSSELSITGNVLTIDTTSSGFGSSSNLAGTITVVTEFLGQPCTNIIDFIPEFVLINKEIIYEFNEIDESEWSFEDLNGSKIDGKYKLIGSPEFESVQLN